MDFFTVGTMLGKRLYVFAIIPHKTREIVQFTITENPPREFVRQQLRLFTESVVTRAYLIHDNASMFNIDYLTYNLVSVKTGVEAPNMTSIMERFFRTVRREALENVLLTGKSQVQRILDEYVAFYNAQRPHQGIQQQIPKKGEPGKAEDAVRKSAVQGGLHHHYYRHGSWLHRFQYLSLYTWSFNER
jgi:transposase InsO family protein